MRRWTRAVTVVMAMALLVTTGILALAGCGGTSSKASQSGRPGFGGQPGDIATLLAKQLDPLVEKGTITSDQEKAVVAAFESTMAGGGQGGQAPSPGSLQQQPQSGGKPGGGMFTSVLASLVKNGTITSAQSKAISQALMSGQRGFAVPSGAPSPQSL
jgi:polyhydroxyalkanoate synthesis regulator phasin